MQKASNQNFSRALPLRFTDQSLLNANAWNWVGLANYQKLFSDPVFRLSFIHSLQLTVAAVVLQVVWAWCSRTS